MSTTRADRPTRYRGARATGIACARSLMYPPVGEAGSVSSGATKTYRREYGRVCGMCAIIAAYNRQFAIFVHVLQERTAATRRRIRVARAYHHTGAALRLEPLDYSVYQSFRVPSVRVGYTRLGGRGGVREPALYSLGVLYVFGSGFINNYFRDSRWRCGILCGRDGS